MYKYYKRINFNSRRNDYVYVYWRVDEDNNYWALFPNMFRGGGTWVKNSEKWDSACTSLTHPTSEEEVFLEML